MTKKKLTRILKTGTKEKRPRGSKKGLIASSKAPKKPKGKNQGWTELKGRTRIGDLSK